MADKVDITLVFYVRDEKGKFTAKEFPARINALASLEVLLPVLLETYKEEVKMGNPEQLDIFLELPRTINLAKAQVMDGSRIIIMPNIVPNILVERQDKKTT